MASFIIPRTELAHLCRLYGVQQMYVFGSAVTEQFDPYTSDVDMLVSLLPAPPLAQGEALLKLWEALEKLFNRRVDLLTEASVRNPYLRAEINRTKHLVYDATGPQVSV